LREYERLRNRGDMVNAAACFEPISKHIYREISCQPDFDPQRKSIVSAFQPKSGGTFLHNRMLQLGFKEYWWAIWHPASAADCYVLDAAFQRYLKGGCTSHTHIRPDPNILAACDRAGVDRIWVHVRNPAACAVSAYHHFLGEGHGEGAAGQVRVQQAIAEAKLMREEVLQDKDNFVLEYLDWNVNWLKQWLKFAQKRPGRVVFSYFHELADPQQMLSRVFSQCGVSSFGHVDSHRKPGDRYRTKQDNDWRHGLSAAVQTYAESCVRANLGEFPQYQSFWD
jgi:hypothetical protein